MITKSKVPFSMTHSSEVAAFAGLTLTEFSQVHKTAMMSQFTEHGHTWICYQLPSGSVLQLHTDKYAPYTIATLFDTRKEYDAWMQTNDPRATGDIENGYAPFGHQRNPAAAIVNPKQDSITAVRKFFAKMG